MAVPFIAGGFELTVIMRVIRQPLPTVYVILEVPPAIPVTAPVEEEIFATEGLLLLHVPPLVVLVNVAVAPTQMLAAPIIESGRELTVTIAVAEQPEPSV
jgi:hypothetical protein